MSGRGARGAEDGRPRPRVPCRRTGVARALAAMSVLGCLCLVAAPLRPATAGTNRVLGDSISLGFYAGITPWPVRAFGEDQFTWAIAGASAGSYVANCRPDCPWLTGAAPDDVWWIMVGTNELDRDPSATVESYGRNLLRIIELIPSQDIRLISSPQVYQWPFLDRAAQAALLDQQAWMDRAICEAIARVTCVVDLRLKLDFVTDYHWDGVHLSDAGHQRVADLVRATIPEPRTSLLCSVGLAMLARAGRGRGLGPGRS